MTSTFIFSVVTFGYLFIWVLYLCYLVFRYEKLGRAASLAAWLFWAMQTGGFAVRWAESYKLGIGHAPLSNLYESMVFFSWSIVLLHLLFEMRYRTPITGSVVMLFGFGAMAYATMAPNVSDQIQPLVPALQSDWLLAHVVTCFLGYAAFAVSCGVSILYMARMHRPDGGGISYLPSLSALDDLIYKSIAVGFPLLTAGIITGAAWAHNAWGAYWSWDPKETWSLITWLIYAAFLHARFTRGWQGKKAALLSIFGFIAVIFTYLGVNLILSGLHSYA
jgi:cytochrome c-type biogenesis protein CcsB